VNSADAGIGTHLKPLDEEGVALELPRASTHDVVPDSLFRELEDELPLSFSSLHLVGLHLSFDLPHPFHMVYDLLRVRQ
jgi:hypothetical protein